MGLWFKELDVYQSEISPVKKGDIEEMRQGTTSKNSSGLVKGRFSDSIGKLFRY